MRSDGLALLVAIAFIASLFLFHRGRRPHAGSDERGLPNELRGATVAYAEQTFRSRRIKLVGKLDRAYRLGDTLKLVELKTRARDVVYMADVIELSVQRIALQDETDEAVAPDAWVVVQSSTTGIRRPHRVALLDASEVEAMRERYAAISRDQMRDLQPARSVRQCLTCGHRERCVATFGPFGEQAATPETLRRSMSNLGVGGGRHQIP